MTVICQIQKEIQSLPGWQNEEPGKASLETEDGGLAKIANFVDEMVDTGIFVRVQSYQDHTDFDRMLGKTVRVTVEVIDE